MTLSLDINELRKKYDPIEQLKTREEAEAMQKGIGQGIWILDSLIGDIIDGKSKEHLEHWIRQGFNYLEWFEEECNKKIETLPHRSQSDTE